MKVITSQINERKMSKMVGTRLICAFNKTYNEDSAAKLLEDSMHHAMNHRHGMTLLSHLIYADIADIFPAQKGYHVSAFIKCLLGDSVSADRFHVAAMLLDKLNGSDADSTYEIANIVSQERLGNTKYMQAHYLAKELAPLYKGVSLEDLRLVAKFLVA